MQREIGGMKYKERGGGGGIKRERATVIKI